MRKHNYSLWLLILVVFGIGIAFYFDFTADDAYIVYRHARNLVNKGALDFNIGEPINALTLPLHTFISAAMFA